MEGGRVGNPPPLRVDTPSLTWSPAVLTVPPVPVIPAGEDPMSVMIAATMPELAAPLAAAVAATHAREEQFAANLAEARNAYQSTDHAGEQEIQTVADTQLGAATPSTAGPVGGQSAQFLSTAVQTAGQAAQAPMQMAGMAAAGPQSVMQGVQGASQQVGQISGQLGRSDEEDRAPADTLDREERSQRDADDDSAGKSAIERAPVSETPVAETPGRHRQGEHSEAVNL